MQSKGGIKMAEVCSKCDGSGVVWKSTIDSMFVEPSDCEKCKGTGVVEHKK